MNRGGGAPSATGLPSTAPGHRRKCNGSCTHDVIVIGTSQGGRFLPIDLAKAGRKVALVERAELGGVCVNTGCTPTKTIVASARLAYQARRGRNSACAQRRHHRPKRRPPDDDRR